MELNWELKWTNVLLHTNVLSILTSSFTSFYYFHFYFQNLSSKNNVISSSASSHGVSEVVSDMGSRPYSIFRILCVSLRRLYISL